MEKREKETAQSEDEKERIKAKEEGRMTLEEKLEYVKNYPRTGGE